MEPFEDKLSAELSALRPTPDPAFAAELDQRAAAGFPRRAGESASATENLWAWLRSLRPRQVLVPAGAAAMLALVVATALIAPRETRENLSSGGGSTLGQTRSFDEGAVFGAESATQAAPSTAPPESSSAGGTSEPVRPDTGPYAAKTDDRAVERSAQIVLGAEPADVAEDAAEVFDAVHAVDGFVLRSSVRGGAEGDAGAEFELLVPSAKLGDALAAFSAIDSVVSRQEATDDITAPTVRTGELLRDSRAKIDGLLVQLAEASTEAERVAAETELRAERRHNAQLRSQLSGLERRANLSRVSLRIETGAGAGPDDSSAWGVGDAFDDAGRILGVAAAVSVIALAVLAPFALLLLLAWLGNRARLRRARERALA